MSAVDINKLIDRLPYADGSGRRRFISGSVILFGGGLLYWSDIKPLVVGIEFLDLVKSPSIVAGIILSIYALGNIIEMFSEFFLIRAVSGVFYAIDLVTTIFHEKKYLKFFGQFVLLFYKMWYYFMLGLIGTTKYKLNLETTLSGDANIFYSALPETIKRGLLNPVGNDSELSFKYVIDQFESESDKRWSKRLINRTKDISVLTSSLFLLIILSVVLNRSPISNLINPTMNRVEQLSSLLNKLDLYFESDNYALHEIRPGLRDYGPAANEIWFDDFKSRVDTALNHKISSIPDARKSHFQDLIKEIDIGIDNLRDDHIEYYSNRTIFSAIIPALMIAPFIFLYLGFFKSLNVAVLSILELRTLRDKEKIQRADSVSVQPRLI